MNSNRIPKKHAQSIISETLKNKKTNSTTSFENFKVSFQYIDTSQKFGSGFKDWQLAGLLSKMLDVFQGYCCSPLIKQVDGDKFALYGGFPPKTKRCLSIQRMFQKMLIGQGYT